MCADMVQSVYSVGSRHFDPPVSFLGTNVVRLFFNLRSATKSTQDRQVEAAEISEIVGSRIEGGYLLEDEMNRLNMECDSMQCSS